MNISKHCLILLILSLATSYSLDGLWKLQVDSSYTQINPASSITFHFHKEIEDGKIVNYMTVEACQTVQFTYSLEDNDVYFAFSSYLTQNRECNGDEAGEVRRKSEKVFYTMTIGNTLLFIAPNGQTIFKLLKIKAIEEVKQFSGKWNAFQISGQRNAVLFSANASSIEVCDGQGVVNYNTGKNNLVRFKIVQTKGCRQYPFFTALHQSKYYRIKKRVVLFYNDRFQVINKWLRLSSATTKSDQDIRNEGNGVEEKSQEIQGQSQQPIQPKAPEKQEQVILQTSNQKQLEVNSQKQAQIQNKEIAQKIKKTQAQVQTSQQEVQTNEKPEEEKQMNGISGQIQIQKITSKWFPIHPQFAHYYIIIMANRLMVYGGCNVYFSMFEFAQTLNSQVQLTSLEFKSSNNECGDEDEALINRIKETKYVQPLEDYSYLRFANSQNEQVLMTSSTLSN